MTNEVSVAGETGQSRQLTRTKKRHTTIIQIGIALALIAAMYISFNTNVLSKATPVPMKIGQLVRYQFETEKDAIPQIRRLYNTNIPIVNAYVAHYESEGTILNVWVAEGADEADVRNLLNDLTASIEAGRNATYSDLREENIAGITVNAVMRGNEPNYYYHSGKKFVWLNIQGRATNATQIVSDAIRTIGGHSNQR